MGVTRPDLTPPVPINETHDIEPFACGEGTLDLWLKERALKTQGSQSARTYVVCDGSMVVGYYCLATGAVVRAGAAKSLQRNMPDPIPVMVLGRLAIDQRYQGHGIGQALLGDAIRRTLAVSEQVDVVALLAHALNEQAKRFYLRYEFLESPLEPLTMMLPVRKALQALQDSTGSG